MNNIFNMIGSNSSNIQTNVNGILKGDGEGNITKALPGEDYASTGTVFPVIVIYGGVGSEFTVTDGSVTYNGFIDESFHYNLEVANIGTYTITCVYNNLVQSKTLEVTNIGLFTIRFRGGSIYGAEWDGTSTTAWTRTDRSRDLDEPKPALGSNIGYSPYDELYPWSEMVRVTDEDAGELVAIPKFWYKWQLIGTTLKLQIADYHADGFSVSPAHADRGDGEGERDVVYIARYRCDTSFRSISGSAAVTKSMTILRQSITTLGKGIYQQDYAMHWTICMLYLVEYADWDSQKTIGYGGGTYSAGASDNMNYHTGTIATSRTSYNAGTQYRYIEGLWANGYEFLDGCYFTAEGLWIINTPSMFNSDKTDGVLVGLPAGGGYPKSFAIPSVEGYEWALYVDYVGGSTSTYIPDYKDGGSYSTYPALQRGYSGDDLKAGLFAMDYYYFTTTGYGRLMKLPFSTTEE